MKFVLEKKKKSEPAVRKNRLFECSNRKVLKDRNSIFYFFGEVSNIRELKKIGLPERTWNLKNEKYLKTTVMEWEMWNIEWGWSVTLSSALINW